jgi:hypothetical protein
LVGALPFDDESFCEKEIARQTIYDPVPFPDSLFHNISSEAIQFIESKNIFIFRFTSKRS